MAAGMVNYLQENAGPEIAMAVHQTARFYNNPMLCHEKAIINLGRYLLHIHGRVIIYQPDISKGLEYYVEADLAGGWSNADAEDAENAVSQIYFLIMYANCPIYWASKVQTEITLALLKPNRLLYLKP